MQDLAAENRQYARVEIFDVTDALVVNQVVKDGLKPRMHLGILCVADFLVFAQHGVHKKHKIPGEQTAEGLENSAR